jgi:hypothetical protein
MGYYVNEVAWFAFTPNEQQIMEKTIQRFRAELVATGFLSAPLPDHRDGAVSTITRPIGGPWDVLKSERTRSVPDPQVTVHGHTSDTTTPYPL